MKESPVSPGAIDPVCGMTVIPARAAGSHRHAEQTYFFCSRHCLEKFKSEPLRYLQKAEASPALVQLGGLDPPKTPARAPTTPRPSDDVVYTCPMHPEVRQRGPGSCPKCGMALEPET